jgi:hypothetical protein
MPKLDTDVIQLTQRSSPTSAPPSGEYGLEPTSFGWIQQSPAGVEEQIAPINAKTMVGGRLTLTGGVPITTSDVIAATTLYYTPYIGNQIALYDSTFTCWRAYTFTERSLSLSGLAASTPRDIFIYDNAGTITLESVAWTNDTTRAAALATQDNILVQSGNPHKRYLGMIRTTGTIGQCEDSVTKRFVWNHYNRVWRRMAVGSASSHTYNSAAVRSWNNDATLRVEFIIGVVEEIVQINLLAQITAAVANFFGYVGFGINSTTAFNGNEQIIVGSTNLLRAGEACTRQPTLGYTYYQLLQQGNATNAPTFDLASLDVGMHI